MPLNYLATLFVKGPENTPGWSYIRDYGPWIGTLTLLKMYFMGTPNTWDRDLHGKVFIVTGGTSGIGAALVKELATKGAQVVVLTSQLESDNSGSVWVTNYAEDLRKATDNPLIYVEKCDLSDLYSVRKFATEWLDSKNPRRLDGVVCLASECLPVGHAREVSTDGIESQLATNYLGHYQLLTLLAPCLKAQPPDRDVRIVLSTCMTQSMGQLDPQDLLWEAKPYPRRAPWRVFGTSKLLLHMFGKEFQRRLVNKDGEACPNVKVEIVNPGATRSPSMRRSLSMGSIWGLLFYLLLYPLWWLVLKSCEGGMQSIIWALCNPSLMDVEGGQYIRECAIVVKPTRKELGDAELQKDVYDKVGEKILELEKASAMQRNRGKKADKKDAKKDAKKAAKKASKKAAKKDAKEDPSLGIFKSAFENQKDVYPGLRQRAAGGMDEEAAKNARLKRLDQKYEESRKKAEAIAAGKDVPEKIEEPDDEAGASRTRTTAPKAIEASTPRNE